MVSVKVGIDGNTSRSLRHKEHTCHYGMVATFERYLYRLGQGELCTLIVIDTYLRRWWSHSHRQPDRSIHPERYLVVPS